MGNDEDSDLFRKTVGDVDPIDQDRISPFRQKPKPIAKQRQRDEQDVVESLLSIDQEEIETHSGEALSFARPGLQHTVLKKLRKGQFVTEAALDLHGYTVAEAAQALADFIRNSQSAGYRCVRIVHGKGQRSPDKIPILKTKVNSWLRQKDEVMAFSSARQVDGGAGALYVLLRKK